MSEKEVLERLDAATDGLIGDTEPVRRLVLDLWSQLAETRAELLSIESACEGELTALEARQEARRSPE